jgi:hypothetical protein
VKAFSVELNGAATKLLLQYKKPDLETINPDF